LRRKNYETQCWLFDVIISQTKEIKDRWNQPSGQKIFNKGYRD